MGYAPFCNRLTGDKIYITIECNTNTHLKGDTERREFFALDEEERAGNTVVFPSDLTKYDVKKTVANVLF